MKTHGKKISLLITSTDAERTLDKIQHPFINAQQIEYRWNIPKYKKDKCTANKIFNDKG